MPSTPSLDCLASVDYPLPVANVFGVHAALIVGPPRAAVRELMSRLLFLIPNLGTGGAERVVVTVASGLAERGVDVHLGVIDADGPLRSEIDERVMVHEMRSRRAATAGPSIVKLVRSIRPDVVWSHLSHLNLALATVRRFLPRRTLVVVEQHSMPSMDHVSVMGRELGARSLRWYRFADRVVACSPAVAEELVTLCGLDRDVVEVIENPVDTDRFRPQAATLSPFVGDGSHILGLGSFKTDKAFERLIAAFNRFSEDRHDVDLWIVGDGAERAALEQLREQSPHSARIHMPGVTTEPELWMCHADVFVSTSRVEAQPLVVLEGLACGTPVVAYDAIGGIGDVLRGASGALLVDDGDIAGMAEAIGIALSEDFPSPTLPEKHSLAAILDDFERMISTSSSGKRNGGLVSERFRRAG
ncbi:MAG: glycosyltransferase involved in cell wall biosynthesis [Candidatus Poriferisodalaceae bacterium]